MQSNIADSSRESISRAEKREKQLKNIKESKDFKKRCVGTVRIQSRHL